MFNALWMAGRTFPGLVLQQQARPLDLTHRGGTGGAQVLKAFEFLLGEDQSSKSGLSGHALQTYQTSGIL
jgi:hypothetical protein